MFNVDSLWIDSLLMIAGIVMLVIGGERFVEGAILVSRKFGVGERAIGLTLVAMGTSLPELASTLMAAVKGHPKISLGNVLGSNVCNTLLIAGAGMIMGRGFAGFKGLRVSPALRIIDLPLFVFMSIVFLLVANDWLSGLPGNMITRTDGLILLLTFTAFLYILYVVRKEKQSSEYAIEVVAPTWRIFLYVLGGLAALILGGWLAVEYLARISEKTGFSEYSLSAVVLALGTSLPELVVGIAAVVKSAPYMAMGNVLGSNIFNLAGILGITAVINPIPFELTYNADVILVLVVSLIFWFNPYSGGRFLPKYLGFFLVATYIGYIFFVLYR